MASGLYLSLFMGPMEPIPAPKPVIDALVSVEVHINARGRSGFELSFTLSDRSPLQTFFLLASGSPLPIFRVVIVATMNGIPQVLMDGVLGKVAVQPAAAAGQSTLTLTGEDLGALMDRFDFSGLPYPGMPAEVRVETILAKYAVFGVVPNVIPSVVPDIEIPIERISTHHGTDLKYVEELAAQAGYVFYFDPGPLPGISRAYWGPEIKFGIPQAALNVNMDTWTNVESLQFHYEPEKSILPIVFIQEQLSKLVLPIPIPPVTPLDPPLGAIIPPPLKIEPLPDSAKYPPALALMTGMAKASENADIVRGEGSLDVLRYGQILKARQLVGVRGAGLAFDGLHYVQNVTHRISRGQYKQSFTLTRNGLVTTTPVVPTFSL
jgi:hypothetical protein